MVAIRLFNVPQGSMEFMAFELPKQIAGLEDFRDFHIIMTIPSVVWPSLKLTLGYLSVLWKVWPSLKLTLGYLSVLWKPE